MTGLHEECGVFGVYAPHTTDVAAMTYAALYALQHRGQESCGIVVNDRGVFAHHKDLGLVPEVFQAADMEKLGHGNISIGHVRYSTTGKPNRANAQPIVVRHVKGSMSIAHNGNLTNSRELRERYELKGAIFHTTNDTEVISYAITEQRLQRSSIEEAVEYAMYDLKGAYSLVDDVAEQADCSDSVDAEFERDIEPGEIVVVEDCNVHSIRTHCGQKRSMCVFEYVYFARPDSVIEGTCVHTARLNAGRILWQEHPVEADVVVGVPDSGLDAALGLSMASGIPYGIGFVKNRYVGRTFIQPSQKMRTNSVRIKLNVLKSVVKGKRVILVDDSIVRGTTCKRIVNLLREAGATEVHMRISCPPFTNPCYFGVDIDSRENLIACQMTIPEICSYIGADSLGYLSLKGVKSLTSPDLQEEDWFCTGCFDGTYPIAVPKEMPKDKFESKIGE